MIRPLTFLTMLMAASSGAYLFAVKHRAEVLEDQIAATADASRLDAQRIRVLQAQWAQETDPSRLSQLAAQFTTLTPMKPAQLIALASMRDQLPPPGSAAPGANPEGGVPVLPVLPMVAATAPAVAHVLPLPPDAPPPPPPPLRLAAAASVHAPHGHSMLHLADTKAVRDLAPPRPVYAAASLPARNLPLGAAVMSVKAVAQPPAGPYGGSMLGMAAALPPPVPLSGVPN